MAKNELDTEKLIYFNNYGREHNLTYTDIHDMSTYSTIFEIILMYLNLWSHI